MTTEQVPMNGFNVPALPPSAQVSERPNAASMQPGFVAPAAPAPAPAAGAPTAGTFTQDQVNAMIAAALAGNPALPVVTPPASGIAPQSPGAAITPGELSTANDPVLKSMTSMFVASGTGVDMERALGKALTYGDPALIDTAYIAEKGGAQAANLAVMAKAIVERVQTQAAAGEQAAYAAAGDKATWVASAAVFDRTAPAHTKLVVKAMLDSGDAGAVAAAAKTVVEFATASGQVVVKPGLVAAGAPNAGGAQALGKAEFQALHAKLNPNSPSYTAERGQLFIRRQQGKALGI